MQFNSEFEPEADIHLLQILNILYVEIMSNKILQIRNAKDMCEVI